MRKNRIVIILLSIILVIALFLYFIYPHVTKNIINPNQNIDISTQAQESKYVSVEPSNVNAGAQLEEEKSLKTEVSSLYVGTMIAIILLFFISLVTNYTLLRWRSKYKNQLISFPESLQDQFENLSKEFTKTKSTIRADFGSYTENLKKQTHINQEVSKNVTKKYDEILESFSMLQKNLNQKDEEIERLKKGYDLQILKKYVIKLMRVSDTCDAIIQDPKTSNETKSETTFIFESLHDLLEELGIEKYTIKAGVSTKAEIFGLPPASEWIKVIATKEDQIFKVKKTIKDGYFINAETKEVLKFPQIEVYVEGENNG